MAENVLIKDVEFNWAKLVTPFKNQFGGENYEMQIVTSADRKDELEAAGLKTKELEDGRISANLKRKAMKRDGTANDAPRVVDGQRSPIDGNKIGNGSRGNVIVYKFDYEFAGNTGVSTSLTAVQVTDLVIYEGGSAAVDFDVVEASGETSPF